MKTARQILIEEHASAEAELERIQARVLALGLDRAPARQTIPRQISAICELMWLELFVPAKRIWIGFGAAWLAIVALNLGDLKMRNQEARLSPAQSRTILTWKEQQRLVFDLSSPLEMQLAEPPKPPAQKPRGECRRAFLIG